MKLSVIYSLSACQKNRLALDAQAGFFRFMAVNLSFTQFAIRAKRDISRIVCFFLALAKPVQWYFRHRVNRSIEAC